jgi:NAD(P)-dependent dehydrogenase (short-subunit alcohol dehydrogenase family)
MSDAGTMSTAPLVTSIQREPELAAMPSACSTPRESSAPSAARHSTPPTRTASLGSSSTCQPQSTVMVTAGRPYYARLADIDFAKAHREVDEHLWLTLHVAREAAGKIRPGGTLLFMSGTDARRPRVGGPIVSALTAGLPALVANLALELGPVRVNLICAGFVDTPLSASLLGEQLDERRDQLRATLPIGRVVGPAEVAALAVHLMSNTALTGATYDIDGGQQLV